MAIDFDGIDDFVDCGNDASLAITGSLTMSVWLKINNPELNVDTSVISKKATWDAANGYELTQNPFLNRIVITAGGSNVGEATSVNLDTNWHQILTTISGTTCTIYVDGVDVTTDSVIGALASDSTDLKIGVQSGTGAEYFDGTINELAIWNVALSTSEISQLYNSKVKGMPLQIQPANLVGYWPMDDGPHGQSADGDTVKDLSGNGNDGTGNDGANNTGLTWKAEEILSYPPPVMPVLYTPVAAPSGNPWYAYAQQ